MSAEFTNSLALVMQKLALTVILAFAFRSFVVNLFSYTNPRAIVQLIGDAFIFWGFFLYAPVMNPTWFPGLSLMVFGLAVHMLPDFISETLVEHILRKKLVQEALDKVIKEEKQ